MYIQLCNISHTLINLLNAIHICFNKNELNNDASSTIDYYMASNL